MTPDLIDLVSDTATRPTPGMRRAMAEAEVGDEQRGEDPSVNRLCERIAVLLGKEDAIFLPSGTMCNQVAIAVHCRPGDEVYGAETAHIFSTEGAGPAVLAGAQCWPIATETGIFTPDDLARAVRPGRRQAPNARLIEVEQTVNRTGGVVWPLAALRAVGDFAKARGLIVHMDGARLFNAGVASGVSVRDFAAPCDSVWIDLSKGLGCPVGGVLAGSAAFIEAAWRWKYRLGGAMRQAGILAAAGLYALDHHVERLADDHANARLLADSIADVPGIAVLNPGVETNMVFIEVSASGKSAPDFAAALEARGVRLGASSATELRAVTHLDVDAEGIGKAARAIRAVACG